MGNLYRNRIEIANVVGIADWVKMAVATAMTRQTPTGICNGTNDTFTIDTTPSILFLFCNGMFLTEAVDYSLNGKIITFLPDKIPHEGDVLASVYWT